MKRSIRMQVNGEWRRVDVEPMDLLSEVLREKLGVKSPKVGCDRGDCGSCTVLLDGKSVRSCLILAVECDGMSVETVEGLGKNGLTELQEAFVEHNSFQCGYCAPGIVITATELLQNNPTPTTDEVKESLTGNLCRCTGYQSIIDAIEAVAKKNKGDE